MIRVRRVEDVAIVDWTHKDVAALVPRLRALVESREASRALLDMSAVESLKGDGLETLTEALSVCEDGDVVLGMYGLTTFVAKLLGIMGLENVMPAVLGATEAEALARVKTLRPTRGRSVPAKVGSAGAGSNLGLAEVEIEFEPQEAAAPARAPTTPRAREDVVVEFDIDAPAPKKAATPARGAAPPPIAATLKFDRAGVGAVREEPEDILAISWADLAAQGIPIGGPGARDLLARAAAEAGMAAPGQAPTPEEQHASTQRPTARFGPAGGKSELEIDLGDTPSHSQPLPKPRAFKTEVIPTFDLNAESDAAAEGRPPARGAGIRADETNADSEETDLEVDFEPARAEDDTDTPTPGLFGQKDGEEDAPEWSPLATQEETRRPPALQNTPAPPPERTQTPPRPMPARPAPTPVPPTPARAQPPTPARPAQPATPATPARPAPAQPAAAHAPAPPPVVHTTPTPLAPPPSVPQAAPAPAPGYFGGDAGDETVMFQPDGFLAEVLAAVSPTGTPEAAAAPARPADTSLDLELRSPLPAAAPAPAAATPAAAAPAPAAAAPAAEGQDELKKFMVDYALVSELHLRVLERFSREGTEKVLGRPEVQQGVGGSAAGVATILEDFVQARLLRRRRSPRVRGGTGFLYAPSPKTRNAVTRLLKLYEDGETRAQVLGWVQAARQAAGA